MQQLNPGLHRGAPCGGEAPHTGTTIVACVYNGGVVLGSDGRVSVGNYISNRSSNKIAPLADHVFLLRSGSAPDAQIVSDHGKWLVLGPTCNDRMTAICEPRNSPHAHEVLLLVPQSASTCTTWKRSSSSRQAWRPWLGLSCRCVSMVVTCMPVSLHLHGLHACFAAPARVLARVGTLKIMRLPVLCVGEKAN